LNNSQFNNNDNFSQYEEAGYASPNAITMMSITLAVLKRPWILLVSLLFVLIPLSIYLLNISTVYKSSAAVMVSVRNSSGLDIGSIIGGRSADVKPEKYYTSILQSKAYRDDVVESIFLMFPHMPRDSVASIVNWGIGYATKTSARGFITLSAKSESKEFALILAQTALEQFKTRSVSLEREDAFHVSEFINDQVESISVNLEKAAEDLQTFVTEKKLMMIGLESGITQELFNLESKHNDAKAKLELVNINIKSYNMQMDNLLNKLTESKTAVNEDDIATLKEQLTKLRSSINNAESLGLTAAEIEILTLEREQFRSKLIGLTTPATQTGNEGEFNAGISMQKLEEKLEVGVLLRTELENQVELFSLQITRFHNDHPNLSEDILAFASLNRTKEIHQKTLDILLEKREEIRISIQSEMGGVKILDAPRLPNSPIESRKTQKLSLGILLALGLGFFLSILVDKLDDSIKDENDIFGSTGLSVFGTIPSLDVESQRGPAYGHRRRKKESDPVEVKAETTPQTALSQRLLKNFSEKSPTAESYRSLKIALEFIAVDKSKKMFTISSSSASEGKSLTSANLATSFAQGGKRTLIIDCDLRKSVQHKYFSLDRKPGLTNYLFGEVELEDIVVETAVSGLFLITAGSSPSNPAELLESHKMQELLKLVRGQYDYILIDTPPILVCSDSRVLTKYADGMVVLVKVESTTVKALQHAIALTQHLEIEILGIIMNQVKFRYGRAYYYTYRYYKPYSYYGGYYYNNMYYNYTEGEDGEKVKMKRTKT